MDRSEIGQVLRKLVATDGPSGGEGRIATVVQALCAPYATDVRADVMGSVVAHRVGATLAAPGRIMLAAHMDEIGLLVTKVEGTFLHVTTIGGVDPRTAIGQEVTVYASGPGSERYPDGLPGYLGGRPPHLLSAEERAKVVPMGDLRVDLGFQPAGCVRIGDRAVWRGPYTELLGGHVAAKSLDNRASLAAMIGALGYLAQGRHAWDVYAVATVQEEVGLRGARASGFTLAPDIAVAIDVTFADTPGVSEEQTAPMDKGPSLAWGPNLHPGLVSRLRAAAEALEDELYHGSDPRHVGN